MSIGSNSLLLGREMEFLWSLLPYTWRLVLVVFVWNLLRRSTKVAPKKPFITNVLDSLLAIPFALKVGPWGKPNDINEGKF